jgi:outer membrane receptor for ferrienterochelin and colicins
MMSYQLLRSPLCALLLLACLASGRQAGAQAMEPSGVQNVDVTELSIAELMNITVQGASKYAQRISEAPSSVSIVTADDIKQYGYRTIADILRSRSGFSVTYDRNYSYIGVRGFGRPGDYNTRVLLTIDGHRMNDNIYDQAAIGTEAPLDVDLIERVEIIRGPGSSLYGNNAFFGVVNIVTRRGRDLKGGEVSGEAGSFDTYKGRLSYGSRSAGGTELIASGTAYDSKGDRLYFSQFDPANPGADPRANNGGYADHADYDRFQQLFSTIAFGDFTLQGVYSSRTKGIPTGAYVTDFNEPQSRTTDIRSYVDLRYQRNLAAGTDLTVRIFYDYYQYTGDYAYFTSVGTLNRDVSVGSWFGSELRLTMQIQDRHRLVIGAEYQGSLREDQQNYDVGVSPPYLDDMRRSRIIAAYLQDEMTIAPSLLAYAGVRYDHYDTFGGTTNPRLALIARPSEASTVKLIFGTAFRSPNDYELYYASSMQVGNPGLKPEKIRTAEMVYERGLGDHLRASATGYVYRIKDLINYGAPDPVTLLPTFENIDEVDATGGEFELAGRWEGGTEARIDYTVQRTKDRTTGEPLTNSPPTIVKAGMVIPLVSHKVFGGIEEQYVDRRRTEGGGYASSFFTTNLTVVARNILPRLDASCSVYDLFDKEFSDPVSLKDLSPLDTVRQDGRNYRIKLTYAF